jgi:hypothetical protein
MKTESGATSVGAPHSKMRMLAEAEHAYEQDNINLLLLTPEGQEVLAMACKASGCDLSLCPERKRGELIEAYSRSMFPFLSGFIKGAKL